MSFRYSVIYTVHQAKHAHARMQQTHTTGTLERVTYDVTPSAILQASKEGY